MQEGTVKWFSTTGKVSASSKRDDAHDVFVHHSANYRNRLKSLTEGEQVTFEVEKGPKGLARG